MSQFKKFKEIKEEYKKACPKEITIFVNRYQGNELIPNPKLIYHFLFSENKITRSQDLDIRVKNTEELYRIILQEFFSEKKLVAVGYDKRRVNISYKGINLENSLEQRLNIYFSPSTLFAYKNLKYNLLQKKQQDFFAYASQLLEENQVNRFVIRPTIGSKSHLIYILDNYQDSPSLSVEKQLGYYYQKEKVGIERIDLDTIFNLISYFIKLHIHENLDYSYRVDGKYQTQALIIKARDNKRIEIMGETLIDKIEQSGIIDNLAALKECEELIEQSVLLLKKQ